MYSVAIAAHPSGDGYWVLRAGGRVTAYGLAAHHGDARSVDAKLGFQLFPRWEFPKDARYGEFANCFAAHSTGGLVLPLWLDRIERRPGGAAGAGTAAARLHAYHR